MRLQISLGWWLMRNGHVVWIHEYDDSVQYMDRFQPWLNTRDRKFRRCSWSDDGIYVPGEDSDLDLMAKLTPTDPRVIAYEAEHGRPVPVPAEPEIKVDVQSDLTVSALVASFQVYLDWRGFIRIGRRGGNDAIRLSTEKFRAIAKVLPALQSRLDKVRKAINKET